MNRRLLTYTILLFSILPAYSQVVPQDIIKTWDGGLAFQGKYKEQRTEMTFFKNSFTLQYGPNFYNQYTDWEIKEDTLIIIRKDKDSLHYPKFKILKLNQDNLHLIAINWPAVYISNSALSAYTAKESEYWDNSDKDLTQEGVLNTELKFKSKN